MLSQAEKAKQIKEWLKKTQLDSEVVGHTLGMRISSVTPEAILAATKKLIKINKLEAAPDSRDDLRFNAFYGLEDYVKENVYRDVGKLQQKAKLKMQQKKNLSWLSAGFFSPQVRNVITGGSPLTQNIEGHNPMDVYDLSHKVTKLGPGGIKCFDDQTEVLTAVGWLKWEDVNEHIRLACRIDGQVRYCTPTKLYSYDFQGELHGYQDQSIDYLVTAGHRMYVSEVAAPFEFVEASEVHGKFVLHYTSLDTMSMNIASSDNYYTKKYKGKVYCAEVPGGLLFTRRNNKTLWSGNSVDAAPAESRQISESHFGLIDPMRVSESLAAGLDYRMSHNVVKGQDNKLYKLVLDKNRKPTWISHETYLNSRIGLPEA